MKFSLVIGVSGQNLKGYIFSFTVLDCYIANGTLPINCDAEICPSPGYDTVGPDFNGPRSVLLLILGICSAAWVYPHTRRTVFEK